MASKGQVTLRGAFPAGSTVGLYDRTSDVFSPGQTGRAVKSGKVSDESEVSFSGLEEGDRYWAAAEIDGEWRARAVTVKGPRPPKRRGKPLSSAAPGFDTRRNVKIVTGARNTKNTKAAPPGFWHESIGQPSDSPEEVPFLSQEDSRNVPQRSSTITGEAHPKPKDEFQPAVPQSEVAKSAQQRSSTEAGEATVIPAGERDVSPSLPQEDVRGKQRSDTPEGEATPKPKKQKPTRSDKAGKVQQAPSGERASARQPASSSEKRQPTRDSRKSTSKRRKK